MIKTIAGILLILTWINADKNIPMEVEELAPPVVLEESSEWKHSLTLYGWLPSLDGKYEYTIPGMLNTLNTQSIQRGTSNDSSNSSETVSSNFVDKVDAIFMGAYEIRKDKWSFLIDGIYFKMSDSQKASVELPPILGKPALSIATEQELDLILLNLYAGHSVMDTDNFTLDLIAGMRYFYLGVDATLKINNRFVNISPSVDFFDALIGVKGYINISENWYIPYLFDIGAGHSDLTWQAESSLGYRFNWGDVLLTYRHIHYDKDGTGLVQDLDISGPKLGLVFHF